MSPGGIGMRRPLKSPLSCGGMPIPIIGDGGGGGGGSPKGNSPDAGGAGYGCDMPNTGFGPNGVGTDIGAGGGNCCAMGAFGKPW